MTRRYWIIAACLALVPSVALAALKVVPDKMTPTASGLRFEDVKMGTGAVPRQGQTVKVLYTGYLWTGGKVGKKFDSSTNRRKPFEFALGEGKVISGWDEGIATMKVGGKRVLLIPPALGYGEQGAGGVIPANATLVFEVELLGAN